MKSYSLRPGQLAAIVALSALVVAVAVGLLYGLALSVLLLAAGALGLVIALLWASVSNLTGETPLTLDEALGLGAPSPEEEQKRAVLRALKDLEYERSVGKISEADYRDYSARYREEARRLMERVDASLAQARELAEKLVDERVLAAGLGDANSGDPSSKASVPAATQPKTPEKPASDDDDDEPDSDDERGHDSVDDGNVDDDDNDDDDDDDDEPDSDDGDDEREHDKPPKPVTDATLGKAQGTPACTACAGLNDVDAKFCKHCGAALESSARVAREEKTP